jgi:HK97 family phage portal protein
MKEMDFRVKSIAHLPEWAQDDAGHPYDKVKTPSDAYALVPLIYRALRLRCKALARVPILITAVGNSESEKEWPFEENLSELIWKTQAGLLMYGQAGWLKLATKTAVKNLQFINPSTLKIKVENGQKVFWQEIGNERFGPWNDQQLMYFHEYNPLDDIGAGVPATQVCLTEAGLMRYLSRFAAYFFEQGAMPVTVLGIEGNVSPAETQRIEGFFKRIATRIDRAWGVLAMKGNITPAILTPKISDMVIPGLHEQALSDIASAFEIPKSMLLDAANFATSKEDRLSFYQDSVEPAGGSIQEVVNDELLNPIGLEMAFQFEELDIYQEDEADRAGSLSQLNNAGVPLDVAMEILGYDLTEEQWAAIREAAKPKPVPVALASTNGNSVQEQQSDEMVAKELKEWRKFAVNRLGKVARKFETEFVPSSLAAAIEGALELADNEDKIKLIFSDAMKWEAYP